MVPRCAVSPGCWELSPSALGEHPAAPRNALSVQGPLPASGSVTPHEQGRAQPQTKCVPINLTGLLFCLRPSPLALCPWILASLTRLSSVRMVGKAAALPWRGLVWWPSCGPYRAAELLPGMRGSRWAVVTVAAPAGRALHYLVALAARAAPDAVSSSPPTTSCLYLKPLFPWVRPGSSSCASTL